MEEAMKVKVYLKSLDVLMNIPNTTLVDNKRFFYNLCPGNHITVAEIVDRVFYCDDMEWTTRKGIEYFNVINRDLDILVPKLFIDKVVEVDV